MGFDIGQIFFVILIFCLVGFAGLFIFLHFSTSNRYTDGMGPPEKEYKEFLSKKEPVYEGLSEISAPPDGVRDEEIEALLRSGDLKEADELLMMRMEEARLAPVGSAVRIARVSHYIEILKNAQRMSIRD